MVGMVMVGMVLGWHGIVIVTVTLLVLCCYISGVITCTFQLLS